MVVMEVRNKDRIKRKFFYLFIIEGYRGIGIAVVAKGTLEKRIKSNSGIPVLEDIPGMQNPRNS
jgi:hypothetical protein